MRGASLPPVKVTNGHHLRIATAKALSEVETYGKRASVIPPTVAQFEAFITAMTAALTAVKEYPASIVLSGTDVDLSLSTDQTEQLVVTKTPLSGSTSNVAADSQTSYVSSDPTIVTVNATGLITAVAVGSATITATHQNKVSNALAVAVAA